MTTHVTLSAGRQTLTLDQDSVGWNTNYLGFAATVLEPPATWGARTQTLTLGGSTDGTAFRRPNPRSGPSGPTGSTVPPDSPSGGTVMCAAGCWTQSQDVT
ncbi:hypothetical protein [Streptomyces sp. MMG1121]|uniref:hypothetical protein n=1 Tax=Streptomyces sp. MMG1121 TaxID=1415544 RepID=UPI0006BFD07C|nr:hypothetical protein [Streptomyces sp. MMG1121]KOV58842.1 hypothetical protein ADK64_35410 [Streptomyces sp. MMG1121]